MQSPLPAGDREFRHDINALRALAVAVVVLFHFGIPGFSGGFAGVDVFFVISGYLMTRIIMEGAGSTPSSFSVWTFYLARARRIIPALLALILALCIAGWFLLASGDYEQLARQAIHAALFDSNVSFRDAAGYFDSVSHEKWLLHTWSLSVEWQFYILLPLAILLARRVFPSRPAMFRAFLVAFAASLATSIWLSYQDPTSAFYMLHSRAWEMLAGGLVWFLEHRAPPSPQRQRLLVAGGYVAILLAACIIDDSLPWPGLPALLPVLGAALILSARSAAGPVSGHALVQWLGTRSYSIYLWHWPLVVLPAYTGWSRDFPWLAASIAATLLLGDLSYRLVENPSRRAVTRLGKGRGAVAIVVAVLLVVAVASAIKRSEGFPSRLSPEILAIEREAQNSNPDRDRCHGGSDKPRPDCILGGEHIAAIMLGDSHASSLVSALQAAAPGAGDGVLTLSYTSCPTIFGVRKVDTRHGCSAFLDWATARIAQVPPGIPLVIGNRYSAYLFGKETATSQPGAPDIYFSEPYAHPDPAFLAETRRHLLDTWCSLARQRPLYLVQPIPEMPRDVPASMARGLLRGEPFPVAISLAEYHARHDWVRAVQEEAAQQCGVRLLDPVPLLCAEGSCRGDTDGRPRYYDDHHLSESGNRLLVPMFRAVYDVLPAGSAAP